MSYYEDLQRFKDSVKVANVGKADDTKQYEKVTGKVAGVPLLGPYQIRSDEWDALAEDAGYKGATWQDRGAQEAVMSFKFTQLYNQYRGKWDGVAVAWKAGTEAARLIVEEGHPINTVITGRGAEVMQTYVNEVVGTLAETQVGEGEFERAATYDGPFANAALVDERPKHVRERKDPGEAVTGMLTSMRDRQLGKAQQVPSEPSATEEAPTEEAPTEGVPE